LERCRLCLAERCEPAGASQGRALFHCNGCGLVFVPEAHWLSVDDERARYAHHDNTAANAGYVKWLGQVANVVAGLAAPGARVLDFGSGENAILTGLLREHGYDCTAYDPLYGMGVESMSGRHDVIVLCEVIEHLRDLRQEIVRLADRLQPAGAVVVRTQCYPSVAELATWWYARDATHINFFAPRTLELAASLCGLRSFPTAAADIFVWAPRG
jgi:2-polyprenyl-3-methyl-5-hydroxy-6-metoxy-1,4-benzoquinol methylase